MSDLMRRTIPWAIIVIILTVIIAARFIVDDTISMLSGKFTLWSGIIVAFTMILAMLMTAITHYRNFQRRESNLDLLYVLVFFGAFIICFGGSMIAGPNSPLGQLLFSNLASPTMNSIFGATMLFICSGAYRTMRVRRWETILLLLPAFFTMFGNIGILRSWPIFWDIRTWLRSYPYVGLQNVALMTVAIGSIGYALRTYIREERGVFGEMGG